MRFIPSNIHGILDYMVSSFVIASPWIFGFNNGGAATWVPVASGIFSILYSLFTRYEYGAVRIITMPVHLTLDLLGGLLLLVAPWLFDFSAYVFIPHVVMGAFEIFASLLSKKESRAFVPEA